jgi:DNA-binding beta-propeller fold protein YncE
MIRKLSLFSLVALFSVAVACGGGGGGEMDEMESMVAEETNDAAPGPTTGDGAPMFEVDPFWPKPMPNNWLLGSTIGVAVDSRDHVWVVHRGNLGANEMPAALDPPQATECCFPAPPILEFDQEGNLVGHWGGPGEGYDWPDSNHGIALDNMDNVWIGGNGGADSHVLKFTRTGDFLLQVGEHDHEGPDSLSTTRYSQVAKVRYDASANEVYIADGYGNRRVAVVDADSGELKRFWGAYGNEPDDAELPRYDADAAPAHGAVSTDKSGTPQFRNPVHCADPTNDGLVYACDRPGNRVQVFEKDGTFVEEIYLNPKTLGAGAVWDIAFSRDPDQTFAYVADGMNEKVHVLRRKPLAYIYSFGSGGRMSGQFFGTHSIETDSLGNIYTTETYEGKRVQKFRYVGMGNQMGDVGVPRPQ